MQDGLRLFCVKQCSQLALMQINQIHLRSVHIMTLRQSAKALTYFTLWLQDSNVLRSKRNFNTPPLFKVKASCPNLLTTCRSASRHCFACSFSSLPPLKIVFHRYAL